MMTNSYILVCILIMILITNVIRVLPVTLIKKKITNTFFRSFLYYVPYVTLAVMTVPAIMEATSNPLIGLVALIFGVIAAWFNFSLFSVAAICCITVYLLQIFLF